MSFTRVQTTKPGSRLAHDGESHLVYNGAKLLGVPISSANPSSFSDGETLIYNDSQNSWVYGASGIPLKGQSDLPQFIQQVYQEERAQIESTNQTGWNQIDSGFEISITPASTTSKLLFECNLHVGIGSKRWGLRLYRKGQGESTFSEVTGANGSSPGLVGVFLTDTKGIGHASTLTPYQTNVKGMYLDSPTITNTTEPVVYTLYWSARVDDAGSGVLSLNRSDSISNSLEASPISTMTVTEIYSVQLL